MFLVGGSSDLPAVRVCQLLRFKLDRHIVEPASETERNLIVLVIDRRAQVGADIKSLVDRHEEWDRVRDLLVGDHPSIYAQNARTALAEAGSVISEFKRDRMLTGG